MVFREGVGAPRGVWGQVMGVRVYGVREREAVGARWYRDVVWVWDCLWAAWCVLHGGMVMLHGGLVVWHGGVVVWVTPSRLDSTWCARLDSTWCAQD